MESYFKDLLFKEIDLIHSNIKNLDDLIFKNKNFCFAFWGGSIYLIVEHLQISNQPRAFLILLTAIIPLLFWIMDYRWRKHLLQCSHREKNLSKFINSDRFKYLILEGKENADGKRFPFYDAVGWIYTTNMPKDERDRYFEEYLINPKEFRGWRVIKYKEALWFFMTMIVISIVFGFLSLGVFEIINNV